MAKRPTRLDADVKLAAAWQAFYAREGHAAIASLFTEFNLYPTDQSNDPYIALRQKGQRDVLLRLTQLLGLKAEHFADQAWDDTEILDRMMRSN